MYRFRHCPELTNALRLTVPKNERGRPISTKTASEMRVKRYRSLSDLYFAYFSIASGSTFAVMSPAVMEATEAAGGGGMKWIFPAFAAIALGYGAKLLYGRK